MTVTQKLLQLHLVDQQLRGLRKRTQTAEAYLRQQEQTLADLNAKIDGLLAQRRQLEATVHNQETEMASIDERIAELRERMNTSKTNKEYSALLTEVSTLKADRSKIETEAIEGMTQLDEISGQIAELETRREEREKMRTVAEKQRDEQRQEVKDRVEELEKERAVAAAEVPDDALSIFENRAEIDDDVMAPVEEHSRRHMEFACGACQTMLPIELVSTLLGRGDVTQCSCCGVLLYMEAALRESLTPTKK